MAEEQGAAGEGAGQAGGSPAATPDERSEALARLERLQTEPQPEPPRTERPSWRRRKVLVDKQLQFTYAGIYVITSGLLIAGFVTLNVLFYFLFRRMQAQALRSGASIDLGNDFYFYAVINMVFVILVIIGMAFYAIVHSHRIAGPAMRLRRSLTQLRQRDYRFHLQFRARDYLQDIAEHVNGLTDELRTRDQSIAEAALRLERMAREQLAELDDDEVEELQRAAELRAIADALANQVLPPEASPPVA